MFRFHLYCRNSFEKNIILHEGNAVMGKANRLFWKYIKVRTSAFNLKEHFPDTIQVGMPIRSQLLELNKININHFLIKAYLLY